MSSDAFDGNLVYSSNASWNVERPHILVVCCSDGRLQESMDEFLRNHLGICHYDRFYAPGGPGALTPGGYQFLRAAEYCEDVAFLIRVHQVQSLILIFHGAGPDGPDESICAHYRRIMPGCRSEAVLEQQAKDLESIKVTLQSIRLSVQISAYRAEVMANRQVQFVQL